MTLIIDCHGHYTTAPPAHNDWREAQKAAFATGDKAPDYPTISDDDNGANLSIQDATVTEGGAARC